ncbi:hypothetical protein [Aurantibacillus circumpalustris]|uniref:hypothetical protein n=1 Tax=Aurantibacillus circumpalustris TaxID=3036359 RepID=UPI00295AB99D|nr:hypothetical protein [Aurantibacillus circumpalustris]
MKKIKLYFILLSCLCSFLAKSQTNAMLRSQALQAEKNKDWYSASQYYNRLYSSDSLNLKLQYAFAEACRLSYDLDLALRLYYKTAAIDNGRRFPLTFFWIGQLLKNKEQYKEAKKWFAKFYKLKFRKDKYHYYTVKSKIEIEACELAQIYMNNPIMDAPEHLNSTVNSKLSEYGAFEKDSALYFSSIRTIDVKPRDAEEAREYANMVTYSKVYRSEIRNEKFKKIKVLDTLINSKVYHSANTCFNEDETQMIVSRCTALNASDYTCELYSSNLINKKWKQSVRMNEPVNQASVSTTQPNFGIMNGKTVLFFASNRPGGEGGLDIWYSIKNDKGEYEKPINAGRNINSPDDDITPWYVNSENTLYFSSTWHKGLGGFDIFKSKFVNGEFQEPVNAGVNINSSYNDVYYSESKDGKRIYLSSNRKGSFFETKLNCCNDIYRFSLKVDSMQVQPAILLDTMLIVKEQLKLLVPLTLYFHNDEPDPKRMDTTTVKNYETTYSEYRLLEPQYELEYSKDLKGKERSLAKNKIANFFSDSLEAGLDDLKRFSNMLEKVLESGEIVKITLKGYCSPLASSAYNINLAKRRISSLKMFFKQYNNGVFYKYINNGHLGEGKIIFEYVEVGELPASKVSDNLKDKRNSVYSPYAASERKIQIIAISYGK